MRNSVAAALIVLAGISTGAAAQEATRDVRTASSSPACLCAGATNGQAGGPIARLSDVEGQVLRADSKGYTPVRSDAGLNVGDRVVLLGKGTATLTAGATCQARLMPQSTVTIAAGENGAACISQSVRVEPAAHVPGDYWEGHEDQVAILAGAGLGLAAIIAIIAATSGDGDDDDDLPSSP